MTRAAAIIVLDQISKAMDRHIAECDPITPEQARQLEGVRNIRAAYQVALDALRALEAGDCIIRDLASVYTVDSDQAALISLVERARKFTS